MDKRGKQVEGGIHDTRGVIQTNSNIFWPNKLTGNVLNHDKQNSIGSH